MHSEECRSHKQQGEKKKNTLGLEFENMQISHSENRQIWDCVTSDSKRAQTERKSMEWKVLIQRSQLSPRLG